MSSHSPGLKMPHDGLDSMVSRLLSNSDIWKFLSYTQVFFGLTCPAVLSKARGRGEGTKVKFPSEITHPGGILVGIMSISQVMHKKAYKNPKTWSSRLSAKLPKRKLSTLQSDH